VRQKYAGRRIVAVYEPRSYTAQRREFQDDYARAFGGADEIVFASLFRPDRYTKETALDLGQLVRDLGTAGKTARELKDADSIVRDLAPRLQPRDVVLIMSNGGFGGIHQKLLVALGGGALDSGI
jgi:UDP-N-acetylmuramate: L-alanyl-gamma-D-glutamyl-meso-diaminopimelate ligase